MVIRNGINCPELALVVNDTSSDGVFLVEKLIGRGAAINKADTSRYIRREPTPRITCGQSDEAAASKIRLGRETDAFNTDAKVAAPEILYIGTAAPRIVTGKQFVLTDLADIDTLIRVGECRLEWTISPQK